MAPGVDLVLKHLTTERGWAPEVRKVAEDREHLPVEYHVTLWRG
jgi:hypothetical protein